MALVPLNPPAPGAFARRAPWNGPAALKYWHLASLDAPTVAVVWACAFAWAARVHVAPAIILVLALVVWAIYVFDRLLDARAGLAKPSRHSLQERHWFHWRHRRVLAVLAGMATLMAGWLVEQRLAAPALRRDSLLGLATLAYFSGVHGGGLRSGWMTALRRNAARIISRELLVGLLFSAGCVLPVLPSAESGLVRVLTLLAAPAAAFAALAWLNVKAIGHWETAAAGTLVDPSTRRIALWLAALCGVSALAAAWSEPRLALLLASGAVSALLLAWLDRARHRLDAVVLRAAADLVLLTPLALLVAPGLLS